MPSDDPHSEQQLRKDVIRVAQLILERGYVTGTAGNVSARLGTTDNLVITPSDAPYASLKPEDLALCSVRCEHLAGENRPSIELPLHAAVYCARADVGAIIHTHSRCATAVATMGNDIPLRTEETAGAIRSDIIPCAAYAPEGSPELAENVVAALGSEGKALLLAEHGVLAVGSDVNEAFAISELIEEAAKIFMLSKSDGEAPDSSGYFKK
jgi:L-fuculose-phosphate aldolase